MIEQNLPMAIFSTLISLVIIVSVVYRDYLQLKIAKFQEYLVKWP